MKTSGVSRTKRILFGFTLMCTMGISVADSYPGSVSIQLFSGSQHANAVDYHYLPNANVYFSYSTGHYYYPSHRKYPSHRGWQHSRTLPPRYGIHPRKRHLIRGDVRRSWSHQRRQHHGHRSHQQRGWQGWSHGRRQHGGEDRHNNRHDNDRHERGGRHRG